VEENKNFIIKAALEISKKLGYTREKLFWDNKLKAYYI
jgi:hypothetical protein